MNEGQLVQILQGSSKWWRNPDWEREDEDLKAVSTRFSYTPAPLFDIHPDGLYLLRGPRRVGKSVEIKRAIAQLIRQGVNPRCILYASCDDLTATDLRTLVTAGKDIATRTVQGPRYWFLDEITAVQGGWAEAIKWLRDSSFMKDDCVVLSGSSGRGFQEATKALAGRRGNALPSDRILLPMPFRVFCTAIGIGLPAIPTVPSSRIYQALRNDGVADDLVPWLNDLVSAWQIYLHVGGFPQAVDGYLRTGDVEKTFVQAVWDVIRGEALRNGFTSDAEILQLMYRLTLNMCSPVNRTEIGTSIGMHHGTVRQRLQVLAESYLTWSCHQAQGEKDQPFPYLAGQSKVYYTDPLVARLPSLRNPAFPPLDLSKLSQQQVGVSLLRAMGEGDTFLDFSALLYARTATRKEIDFVGPRLHGLPVEGKYVDTYPGRDAQTLEAYAGKGILATRSGVRVTANVVAVPAAFLVLLLDRETGFVGAP